MSGNRLHHPDRRAWGKRMVVTVQRELVRPQDCLDCNEVHLYKTLHFDIDPDGFIIVSDGVLKLMENRHTPLAGFVFVNEVPDPPTQGLFLTPETHRQREFQRLTHERS